MPTGTGARAPRSPSDDAAQGHARADRLRATTESAPRAGPDRRDRHPSPAPRDARRVRVASVGDDRLAAVDADANADWRTQKRFLNRAGGGDKHPWRARASLPSRARACNSRAGRPPGIDIEFGPEGPVNLSHPVDSDPPVTWDGTGRMRITASDSFATCISRTT
jgi:hypothetical protein